MSGLCSLCSNSCRRRSLGSAKFHAKEEDTEAALASSVEWLHSRVDLLLRMAPGESPPQPEALPRFIASRRSVNTATGSSDAQTMSDKEMLKKRRHCVLLMLRLLKRLASVTRRLSLASRLIADDVVCRLLPLAICANFYEMPPACELLLARTLANLSCHRAAYAIFSADNFVCNIIDTWTESPCLVLALCGRKIAANLSTYTLLSSLSPYGSYRPSCMYQPDVFELARPFLAAPTIDIVFVNGMLGSVFYTWKQGEQPPAPAAAAAASTQAKSDSNSDNGGPQVSDCWPRDWLAEDLPRARVLALNMKIEMMKWRGCSDKGRDPAGCLPRRAKEAVDQLLAAGVGNRMTAFVCHSFGGLIVKQLLQVLNASEDRLRKKLLASVRGVVFIAVPHLGRSKAVNVNRIYWRPIRQMCLSEEARNVFDGSCHVLSHLHAWFVQFAQTRADLRVLNLIELGRTPLAPGGFGLKVCPESWADKLVGEVVRLPVDHIQICKPPNRQHDSYTVVLNFLVRVSSCSMGWRPSLVVNSGGGRRIGVDSKDVSSSSSDSFVGRLSDIDWHRPMRNFEEELRLRYGVSSARALWTRAAWLRFGASRRPRFYDLL